MEINGISRVNTISKETFSFIKNGEMEKVQVLMGRPYYITGTVIHGQALGRKLGFPTINLGGVVDQYVLPKPGVYLGTAEINEDLGIQSWNALINAGYRPTVDGKKYTIEAYLLDFSGNLYGKNVTLSFLYYLRDEIKYTDLNALIEQMKLDEIYARTFFKEEENK